MDASIRDIEMSGDSADLDREELERVIAQIEHEIQHRNGQIENLYVNVELYFSSASFEDADNCRDRIDELQAEIDFLKEVI